VGVNRAHRALASTITRIINILRILYFTVQVMSKTIQRVRREAKSRKAKPVTRNVSTTSNVPARSAPAGSAAAASAPAGSAPADPQSPAGPCPSPPLSLSDFGQDEGGAQPEVQSPDREAPARRVAPARSTIVGGDQAPPRFESLQRPPDLCSFPRCLAAPGAPLAKHPCKTPSCPNEVHHMCLSESGLPDVYKETTSANFQCFPCIQALIGNRLAPNPLTGAGPSKSVADPEVFLAAAQHGAAAFVSKKQIAVSLNVVFRRFSEFEIKKSVYMYVLCSWLTTVPLRVKGLFLLFMVNFVECCSYPFLVLCIAKICLEL